MTEEGIIVRNMETLQVRLSADASGPPPKQLHKQDSNNVILSVKR